MNNSEVIDNISFLVLFFFIFIVGIYYLLDTIHKNPIPQEQFTDETNNEDDEDGLDDNDKKLNQQILNQTKEITRNNIANNFKLLEDQLRKSLGKKSKINIDPNYSGVNNAPEIDISFKQNYTNSNLQSNNLQNIGNIQNMNVDLTKKTNPIGKPYKLIRDTFFYKYLIKAISKYFGNKEIDLDIESYVVPVNHHVDPNCALSSSIMSSVISPKASQSPSGRMHRYVSLVNIRAHDTAHDIDSILPVTLAIFLYATLVGPTRNDLINSSSFSIFSPGMWNLMLTEFTNTPINLQMVLGSNTDLAHDT